MTIGNEPPESSLDAKQLEELTAHLRSDEEISLESTLESEISFRSWIENHPSMRQMFIPEKLSDVIPTVFRFLRYMFGLDREPPEVTKLESVQGDDDT